MAAADSTLPQREETPADVLFFYGESCPYTKRALPEVECLQEAMGEERKLQRLEVWNDRGNAARYRDAARGKCGGVPFFLNPKTGNFVCGALPCSTLKERLLQ